MSAVDAEVRADFLAEAGEIVERLGAQLVELESRPADAELLNAIFRAFHTVKGGAGFLQLTPLVEICHVTEDLFNALRNGKRAVDAGLMDAMLQAVDQVQAMMNRVASDEDAEPAPRTLIETLHKLLHEPASAPAPSSPAPTDPLEDEFEALLDQMQAQKKAAAVPAAASSAAKAANTITEDEFEALLDQLAADKKSKPVESGADRSAPEAGDEARSKPVALQQHRGTEAEKAKAATANAAETSVRVDTIKLDRMMNLVGELVLVRNRLKALSGTNALGADVGRAVRELDFITRGLQGAVMQVRMQPVGKVFSRFPKLARDVARGLGKQVEVTLIGQDTDLDKNLVEALADPLVHMVRNSVDHGIEMPALREQRGKPAQGQLRLEARQEGDHIRITVSDDGAGIDPDRIRAKALEKKLIEPSAAAALSREECLQLIFLPGFSTKEQISDLSGRGVGMDVVKSRIQALNGTVSIESMPGQGSAIHLRVPLTLAILPALMVEAGDRQFALPLAMVADVFALDPASIRKLGFWNVVPLRNENLRLIDLELWAGSSMPDAHRHVVVVNVGTEHFGLIVHQVRGREEVVIKPLGTALRGLAGVAGATVTPQGRVALIVDVPGLVRARTPAA